MKLTTKTIAGLESDGRQRIVWDEDGPPGFGVRVSADVKAYILNYRLRTGRERRMTIARVGVIPLPEARRRARTALGQVAAGLDPMAVRDDARGAPTVAELADAFLERHVKPKRTPSTAKGYTRHIEKHIKPRLGTRTVAEVTFADVSRFHHRMRKTPGQANRVVATLSKMMTTAERWGWRPPQSNPCRGIERYPETRRERFLSPAELGTLGKTLRDLEKTEPASAIACVRLLIFTGCRCGEIRHLKWDDVDLDAGRLRIRSPKESKGRDKWLPLNAPAREVLAKLPRQSEWVLPTARGDTPISMAKPWERIRTKAKLEGIRLHDLRHSFASVGAGSGQSLLVIGRLLGHRTPSMTQRYSHLSDDPLREASEAIAGRIASAMSGRKTAKPVSLGREP
jgi:integrase